MLIVNCVNNLLNDSLICDSKSFAIVIKSSKSFANENEIKMLSVSPYKAIAFFSFATFAVHNNSCRAVDVIDDGIMWLNKINLSYGARSVYEKTDFFNNLSLFCIFSSGAE